MFFQVLVGRVTDPDALRAQWERWPVEVAPGPNGWFGSTGGVTDDGRGVLVTRFASAPVAEDDSRRAHDAWWSATSACLASPVTFFETDDVTAVAPAHDPATAAFVQVMRATVGDRARLEQLEDEIGPAFIELRPDFVAGYRAWAPDGTLVVVDHFRSEAEARAGERAEMPARVQAGFQEWLSLVEGAEWFDLTDPWHASAGASGQHGPQ